MALAAVVDHRRKYKLSNLNPHQLDQPSPLALKLLPFHIALILPEYSTMLDLPSYILKSMSSLRGWRIS